MDRFIATTWGTFQLLAALSWAALSNAASAFASISAGLASIAFLGYTLAKWRRIDRRK